MVCLPLLRLSLFPPNPTATRKPYTPLPSSSANVGARFPSPLGPLRTRTRRIIPMSSYNPTPATDRLISAAAYFLPFFNGLQYGRFLFAQYPALGVVLEPILPLLSLYRSVPYASFVAFFALYIGVVRNPGLSRYVRFNAMQALVLDVLLVLPLLIQRIFNPGRAGLGYRILVMSHNALFVFIVGCFVYSLVSSVLGRTPYLPLVAEAAGRQL